MSIVVVIILIFLNGYFSLAEVALISVSREELEQRKELHELNAVRILKLIKNPEEFLSAVQVGTTLLGLLEGIYGGGIIAAQLEHMILRTGMDPTIAHFAALIFGIGMITYLTIVFGELVPKSIALKMPLRISLSIAPSLLVFSKIAYPFIKLLTVSTRLILKTLKIKGTENKMFSEKDLMQILATAYKQGTLEQLDLWFHQNVFGFNRLKAKNIMKSSKFVMSIDRNWNRGQILAYVGKRPYSYFPIYENESSNIIGTLDIKLFLTGKGQDWQDAIIPPCKVKAELKVKEMFQIFKTKRIAFCTVIDKSEQYIGIVAMQDIMEGIFGDLPEKESYAAYFYSIDANTWIADAHIHLQRIRNTLSLPWIRDYEQSYLEIGEMFTGECERLGTEILDLNGIKIEINKGSISNPESLKITRY